MTADRFAQLLLASYLALPVLLVVWQMFRCPGGPMLWLLNLVNRLYLGLFFRCRANDCPVPGEGPALILGNHRSPVDPLFLWYACSAGNPESPVRPIGFMMAKEYYEVPVLNAMFRVLQSIPVARDGSDMGPAREALKHLKEGQLVGLFPEGRINPGYDLMPANPGIAWLALRARVPVYPVFIHNAPQGKHIVAPFYTPNRVRVSFGEPIDLSEYYDAKKTQELLNQVTKLLMTRLAELGGVEYRGGIKVHEETEREASSA